MTPPNCFRPWLLAALLLAARLLVGDPAAGQAVVLPADSAAGRTTAPPPLPRLGLRLSAGRDLWSANAYYQTTPRYWLALEANRWLWRRLSVGVGAMGLLQPEYLSNYDRAWLAQGHVTVTALRERLFSLNLRTGIYIRHGRSDRFRTCDFGCSGDGYTLGGWLLGAYPTVSLTNRWSLDGTIELRSDQVPLGLIGLGVKLRLPARVGQERPQ